MPGPENTWLWAKSQQTHESCPIREAPTFRRQARFCPFSFFEGTVLTWDFLGKRPNCPLGLANAGPARASTFRSSGPCWKIRHAQRIISQVMRLFLLSLKTLMSLVLFHKSCGKQKVHVCQVLLFKANFPKLQLPWLAPHQRLLWTRCGAATQQVLCIKKSAGMHFLPVSQELPTLSPSQSQKACQRWW